MNYLIQNNLSPSYGSTYVLFDASLRHLNMKENVSMDNANIIGLQNEIKSANN